MSSDDARRWRWASARGVLIEHADWDQALAQATALRDAGFATLLCPGPDARGPEGPCPLLAGEECPLVAGADVVISGLGRSRAACGVVETLRRRGGVPVVVVDPDEAPRSVVRAARDALGPRLAAA